MKNDSVVAGGGAIDMELSKYLRNYSRTIAGKEQLIIGAMAKAFEVRSWQKIFTIPKSIEWFIEDQAFSMSYDLARPPPPSLISRLSLFLSLPVCRSVKHNRYWRERGVWGGGGAKSYDAQKAWSSRQNSNKFEEN